MFVERDEGNVILLFDEVWIHARIWNNDYLLPSVEAYFGGQNFGMQSVCPIAEFYLHVTRVCGSVIELYETAPYD